MMKSKETYKREERILLDIVQQLELLFQEDPDSIRPPVYIGKHHPYKEYDLSAIISTGVKVNIRMDNTKIMVHLSDTPSSIESDSYIWWEPHWFSSTHRRYKKLLKQVLKYKKHKDNTYMNNKYTERLDTVEKLVTDVDKILLEDE